MNDNGMEQLQEKNKQLEADLHILSIHNKQLSDKCYGIDDEIDFLEIWRAIWDGKILVLTITAIFSIVAVLYALSVPDEYKSTAVLAPASSSSSSSLSKLAGRFGGLASLAGINIGSGDSENKTAIALETIKAWGFLETFIQNNDIAVELFAVEGWNRANDNLIIDPEIYDSDTKQWVRDYDAAIGQKAKPSSWELYEKFKERISINDDKINGLIRLSVEYYSPAIAKEWTEKLVRAINDHIQKQDRDEATKSIQYLNKKIEETNISVMHSVFYKLIEEQTKTLMLAEISDEYVLKTINPAKIAEEKSQPKRAFIAILGFILGGLLAVTIVITRHFSSKSNVDN